MRIQIVGYPVDVTFETKKTLPVFKYGCEVRTKIVKKVLSKVTYSAPHNVEDFIVEKIEITSRGEKWYLGS